MKRLVIAILLVGGVTAADEPKATKFGKADLGRVPVGWKAAHTGKGGVGIWKVVEDQSAPSKSGFALAQTGESPNAVFNLCVQEESNYKDLEIAAAFKANSGKTDQGGGVIWRYTDANNYYIARFNPLEDNYRLYKVVDGKRTQLATKEELKAPAGEWHILTVTMKGDAIVCSLDGKKYLETKDATFANGGTVGLWTKADAQTSFDNFDVKELK